MPVVRLPLHGVRVVEMAGNEAAAYCGRILGDMGAEVIRVESRRTPEAEGPVSLNCNKYGFSLDASSGLGRKLLLRLAQVASILLAPEPSTIGLSRIARANPSLAIVTFSPPDSAAAAHAGGAFAAGTAAFALWRRRRGGVGLKIEIDPQACLQSQLGEGYLAAQGAMVHPIAPVASVGQPALPDAAEDGLREEVATADGTVARLPGPAWSLSETPVHIRLPPPALGEHDEYVLRDILGLSGRRIASLRRRGVIRPAPFSEGLD